MLARTVPLTSAAVLFLALSGSVGAALERSSAVNFRAVPQHAYPGDTVTATIAVRPARARCTLSVTYRSGERQAGLPAVRAAGGRARWQWRVPEDVEAGTARLRASCARGGTATRSLAIVGAVIPARIAVEQSGFSIRPGRSSGATISFGIVLANESPNQDAFELNVLVNFVDDRNVLWGSKSMRVSGIAAGSRYALGDSISFSGAAPPVTKLEITIQIGGRAPAAKRPSWLSSIPALNNIRIVPSRGEPEWVGQIDGEIINDDPRLYLDRTRFSAVVFDASGVIVGGATGSSGISLPPGARSVFVLSGAVNAIPTIHATSTMISLEPGYRQPGS